MKTSKFVCCYLILLIILPLETISPPVLLYGSGVLIPNIGQYLAFVHILLMKLVIVTQLMRILGLDYVGKGIKSVVEEEGLSNSGRAHDKVS